MSFSLNAKILIPQILFFSIKGVHFDFKLSSKMDGLYPPGKETVTNVVKMMEKHYSID